jgi:hypothetical protein
MKPVESRPESPTVDAGDSIAAPSSRSSDSNVPSSGDAGWRLWPPSPKMQIAMIALGFGLFNLILIAIWAVIMVYRF